MIFFFFWLRPQHVKFPAQGPNQCQSSNPSYDGDTTRSSTCCSTRELQQWLFSMLWSFAFEINSLCIHSLLLCNKPTTKQWFKNNSLLSPAWWDRLLCLGFCKAEINMSARLRSVLEVLEKNLLSSSFRLLAESSSLRAELPIFSLTAGRRSLSAPREGPCPPAPSIFKAGEWFKCGKYFLTWNLCPASPLLDFCLWPLDPDLKDSDD